MLNVLWSLGGVIVLLGIGFLASRNRKAINWRTILVALAIQVAFAGFVFKTSIGQGVLSALSNGVNKIMGYANEGINFLFGGLFTAEGIGFTFALQVLPVIIFFSSLVSLLYYLGVMQKLVGVIGGALAKLLGTGKAETLSATANIFVGCTEAPLVVKPYLSKMTKSELFAVMVGGLASVAGSVLIGYSMMGVPIEYLLTASFMCAPAGLLMAKMIMPETEKSQIEDADIAKDKESANAIDAIARGASDGLQLVLNIGAMLLSFIAIVALLNGILGVFGITLQEILGYVFAPLAFVIGVPLHDIMIAGTLIGEKTVLNEFVAFMHLGEVISTLDPKTALVVTFALCGFANFSVIAILLGGMGTMAPSRRKDIAKMGLLALLAGVLANLISASIAGMFM